MISRYYNPFRELSIAQILQLGLRQNVINAFYALAGNNSDDPEKSHVGIFDYFTFSIFHHIDKALFAILEWLEPPTSPGRKRASGGIISLFFFALWLISQTVRYITSATLTPVLWATMSLVSTISLCWTNTVLWCTIRPAEKTLDKKSAVPQPFSPTCPSFACLFGIAPQAQSPICPNETLTTDEVEESQNEALAANEAEEGPRSPTPGTR